MAWFKSHDAAEKPGPVSPERLQAALTRAEINALRAEDGSPEFYCLINDFPVALLVNDSSIVVSVSVAQRLPSDRADEVLQWVTEMNRDTHFSSDVQHEDEDGVYIAADAPIYTEAGLTDEQLDNQVQLALSAGLMTLQKFCDDFDITPSIDA